MVFNINGMTRESHWRCFLNSTVSFKGKMELQVVQGHQTVAGYVEMLKQALLTEGPPLSGMGLSTGQQAVHNARQMKDLFQEDNIAVFKHPALSPHLDPIENV